MLTDIVQQTVERLTEQGLTCRYQDSAPLGGTFIEVSVAGTDPNEGDNTRDRIFRTEIELELVSFESARSRLDFITTYETVLTSLAAWTPAAAIAFDFLGVEASVQLAENSAVVQRTVFTYRAAWQLS